MDMPPSEVSSTQTDIHERFEQWLNTDDSQESEEPIEAEGENETEEQTEAQPLEDSGQEQTENAEAKDSEETDFTTLTIDGEEIQLPKEVAEKVTTIQKRLEADHTRKTQEAADMKRQAIALQQNVQQEAQFQQQNINLLSKLQSVTERLQEYEQVNWVELAETDFGTYNKHKEMRDQLRGAYQQLSHELENRGKFMQQQATIDHQKRWQFCVDTVKSVIPNYDVAMDEKMVNTAKRLSTKYKLPFDAEALSRNYDPVVWIGLSELAKYYDLLDKRPEVQKRVAAAPKMNTGQKPQKQNQSRESKIRALLKAGRIRDAAELE